MEKIAQFILKYLAKAVLFKYHPDIIGITGSVGKTSTKEAVSTVLSQFHRTRATLKNYNNELGLPLSILNISAPGKSIRAWLGLLFKFFGLMILKDKNYPEILVLEMGVDRPGDMNYLLSIVSPRVAVITGVGESHLAFFGSAEKLRQEKQSLIAGVVKGGTAILNYDNEGTRQMVQDSRVKVLTYGLQEGADFWAQDIVFDERGMHFKVNYQGSTIPVFLDEVLGYPAVYAALAALATAVSLEENLIEAVLALKKFRLPAGRLQLIPGIEGSTIIDDTYNSAPSSALAALEVVAKIKDRYGRLILVLGEMLELGAAAEAGHRQVGEQAARLKPDYLLLVGSLTKFIAQGASAEGLSEKKIFYFATREEATEKIKEMIKIDDLILIKASQGGRLEKLVKELMLNPNYAQKLLVRQDGSWLKS
ncbi:MAG TPA: UDP-N-acetylmuramoyl-tripeptide--D-alanyl-D-alanine ligase [bacterium]|nr:UDP-N-acetylmuramoyl-tripeptide--D-alanyl-D-alanine ligase [bacterium]HPT29602.1 UDP-N-acetylmuramoyl-tripeptide--D-alanyl-D-alanine ligase [bacterium]